MHSDEGSTNSTSVRTAYSVVVCGKKRECRVLYMLEATRSAQRLCTHTPSEESTRYPEERPQIGQ